MRLNGMKVNWGRVVIVGLVLFLVWYYYDLRERRLALEATCQDGVVMVDKYDHPICIPGARR